MVARRARTAALAFCALIAAATAAAPATAHGRRMLTDTEAVAWRGVGRVNVAGRRFCTGTLISARLVATAAHCLYNPRTRERVPVHEIRFVAGLMRGANAGWRRVTAATVPLGYRYTGAAGAGSITADVALLALDAPIPVADAAPLPAGAWPRVGALTIVSYARDRAHAPSIERDCAVIGRTRPLTALDCGVTFGASGAPVVAIGPDGARRLVAVVSAQGGARGGEAAARGDGRALVVDLAPHLGALLAQLGGAHAQVAGPAAGSLSGTSLAARRTAP